MAISWQPLVNVPHILNADRNVVVTPKLPPLDEPEALEVPLAPEPPAPGP